jgi:hypothetical protein
VNSAIQYQRVVTTVRDPGSDMDWFFPTIPPIVAAPTASRMAIAVPHAPGPAFSGAACAAAFAATSTSTAGCAFAIGIDAGVTDAAIVAERISPAAEAAAGRLN